MTATDPATLGTILSVWAHPDDEAYLAGGIMATARAAGQRVVLVTATKGEVGFPDDDPRSVEERAALREREMKECLSILGIDEHHWLGFPDGGCSQIDIDDAVTPLSMLIDEIRPDTILTFGPDGGTYHQDHIAVGRWVTEATRRSNRGSNHQVHLLYAAQTEEANEVLFSLVDPALVMMVEGAKPPTIDPSDLAFHFVNEGEVLEQKVKALAAQDSQTSAIRTMAGPEGYRRMVRDELFRLPTPADFA